MKKVRKYTILLTATFILLGISYLHFAPVNFDVGSCPGGYEKWVVDKYTTDLIYEFMSKQGYDEKIKYTLISQPEEIASTINWDGRIIKAIINLEVDGNSYAVSFIGKRYWIEKYNWKIDNIKLL